MVRCKFVCQRVSKEQHWNQNVHTKKFVYIAEFNVVRSGSLENDAFFEGTPHGNIEIGTYSQDCFDVGAEYFVDLTPCKTGS